MNELTTAAMLIPIPVDDRLPTDRSIRTRLWDSDWTLVYDSDLPGAVNPVVAMRNLLGVHDRVNVTTDGNGLRWHGRARLNDADDVELAQECVLKTPNPLL